MRDDALLRHILDATERVATYAPKTKAQFLRSEIAQDAILRNLQIIGEAAKHLSAATMKRAPKVRWEQIAGMRNFIVHQYFTVDLGIVWTTVTKDIPKLAIAVTRLLDEEEKKAA